MRSKNVKENLKTEALFGNTLSITYFMLFQLTHTISKDFKILKFWEPVSMMTWIRNYSLASLSPRFDSHNSNRWASSESIFFKKILKTFKTRPYSKSKYDCLFSYSFEKALFGCIPYIIRDFHGISYALEVLLIQVLLNNVLDDCLLIKIPCASSCKYGHIVIVYPG